MNDQQFYARLNQIFRTMDQQMKGYPRGYDVLGQNGRPRFQKPVPEKLLDLEGGALSSKNLQCRTVKQLKRILKRMGGCVTFVQQNGKRRSLNKDQLINAIRRLRMKQKTQLSRPSTPVVEPEPELVPIPEPIPDLVPVPEDEDLIDFSEDVVPPDPNLENVAGSGLSTKNLQCRTVKQLKRILKRMGGRVTYVRNGKRRSRTKDQLIKEIRKFRMGSRVRGGGGGCSPVCEECLRKM